MSEDKPDRAYLSRKAQQKAKDSIEETAPTRAHAVLAFIDHVENRPAPKLTRQQRRRQDRKELKHSGHPGRETSRERRRHYNDPLEPGEQATREQNRLMRKYRRMLAGEGGDVAPPLAVVAEFVVPQLLEDFDLSEEHETPLRFWLMARFGDVLREPDIAGYLAWREQSLARVVERTEVR